MNLPYLHNFENENRKEQGETSTVDGFIFTKNKPFYFGIICRIGVEGQWEV